MVEPVRLITLHTFELSTAVTDNLITKELLKVEMYYSDGGVNGHDLTQEERGLYLSVLHCTQEQNTKSAFKVERYSANSGLTKLIKPLSGFCSEALHGVKPEVGDVRQLLESVCHQHGLKPVPLADLAC